MRALTARKRTRIAPGVSSPSIFSGVMHRFARDLAIDPRIAYQLWAERAHEACVRRASLESNVRPAILVGTQLIAGRTYVSFSDNGAALGGGEIKQVYAALQAGVVEQTRTALVAQGIDAARSILGRLGVAMLGAFLIADMVTIKTRSGTDTGTRYTCSSATYTAEPYQIARAGTVVQLRMRVERETLGDIAVVRDVLSTRKRLTPIVIGTEATPINA